MSRVSFYEKTHQIEVLKSRLWQPGGRLHHALVRPASKFEGEDSC